MSEAPSGRRTSYDEVPYASFPFPQTHPDRMATLGRLFALEPPDLAGCRVLELGCAAGGNLIPMAIALPGAQFVGVDLSSVQVAEGVAIIEALGLKNIRLLALSIDEVDEERFGRFDYILTHGVYSWVPDTVQERILRICAEQLSDQGIAYISYNTLPGWRMRGMIRDLMRYHAMPFADPTQRVAQARAILDFLAKWVPTENNAYGMLLKSELEGLRRSADYYILHEHLEDTNEPLYFHEFMARARRHGLQYLAEAEFSTMLAANFPAEVAQTLWKIAPDVIRQEQFMDFLRNRTFRQTLLVRDGLSVNRSLTPERVTSLWIAGALRPVSDKPELATDRMEAFRSASGGMLNTPNPITKAAMVVLARRWPEALSFAELLRLAQAELGKGPSAPDPAGLAPRDILASDLLQSYAAGLIELRAMPQPFVVRPGNRPTVSPLARWQAARGLPQVTTLRHDMAKVDANLGRLLTLLDGTRDREAIYRTVLEWTVAEGSAKGIPRKALAGPVRERVDEALAKIGRTALLLA
jgi:methyltransferase-like protein/SAM-dependent methyltransferase